MPDKTFKYKKATITVRAKRGSDVFSYPYMIDTLINLLSDKLNAGRKTKIKRTDINDTMWMQVSWFAYVILCSSVDGDLGFVWPDWQLSTGEEIYQAYEDLMNGDPELVELWITAYREANLEAISPEE